MTDTALVIGGTRFIGRHTVSDLLANGYEVGMLNRGTHENPFADDDRVTHVEGDRKNERDLRTANLSVDPDIVIDCVAYQP
ncbi:epimerase, partial [Halorubrum sp. E3]